MSTDFVMDKENSDKDAVIGYYNGTVAPLSELMIPALDRAVYFGDGVYDVAFAVNGVPFALEDHLDRFERSCALIEMPLPMPRQELKALVYDLLHRLFGEEKGNGMIYWQASRATAERTHNYPEGAKSNLMMYVKRKDFPDLEKKVKLITAEDLRYSLCHIKTLNLIPNVMANQKAYAAGCDEAILIRDGIVTECSHSSLHILKDGKFITHPADCRILPAISRKHCIELCKANGIPVEEREFDEKELFSADEVLVSSTTTVLRAAGEINGIAVGGKDRALYERLRGLFVEKIRKETGLC